MTARRKNPTGRPVLPARRASQRPPKRPARRPPRRLSRRAVRRNGASVSIESREVLLHPGDGPPWSSGYLGDRDAMMFVLMYPPFIEAIRSGRGLTATPVRVDRDQEAYADRVLSAQEDPIVRRFYQDFARRFPEYRVPPPGAIEDLVVVDVPGALPFRIHASGAHSAGGGAEEIEIFDPTEWI